MMHASRDHLGRIVLRELEPARSVTSSATLRPAPAPGPTVAQIAAQQARDAALDRINQLHREAAGAGYSAEFVARVLADCGHPDIARRRLGLVLAGSDVPAAAPAGGNHDWGPIMAEAGAWRTQASKAALAQREPAAANNYGWDAIMASARSGRP